MISDIRFYPSAIRATDCISQGMGLIQPKYWLFLGITVVGLIMSGCVPCVSIFLAGPVAVGVFFTLFAEMRGQPVEFGMMFKGFEKFVPAMLVGLVHEIPEILGNGARLVVQFSDVSRELNRGGGDHEFFLGNQMALQNLPDVALSSGIILILALIGIGFALFAVAWRITLFFALPLMAEYDLSAGDAIRLSARAGWSNWGGIFVLGILQFLVTLLGVLLCGIGIFFVQPIVQASSAVAFRQVFPDRPNTFNNEPPQPGVYGGTYGNPQQ